MIDFTAESGHFVRVLDGIAHLPPARQLYSGKESVSVTRLEAFALICRCLVFPQPWRQCTGSGVCINASQIVAAIDADGRGVRPVVIPMVRFTTVEQAIKPQQLAPIGY
jgi:hypothetical protein